MPVLRDPPGFEVASAADHAALVVRDADSEECEVVSAAIQHRRVQDAIFIAKIFTPIIPALTSRLRMVVSGWNMGLVEDIHRARLRTPDMAEPTLSLNPASKSWSAT